MLKKWNIGYKYYWYRLMLLLMMMWILLWDGIDKGRGEASSSTLQQRDIYDVIKGLAPQTPKSLDPVYYVGIYDSIPDILPSAFDIEFLTSHIGQRFTCLIPIVEKEKKDSNDNVNEQKDNNNNNNNMILEKEKNNHKNELSTTQSTQQINDEKDTILNTDNMNRNNEKGKEEEDDSSLIGDDIYNTHIPTAKELMKEFDILETREEYLHEIINDLLFDSHKHTLKRKNTSRQQRDEIADSGHTPQLCYDFHAPHDYWSYQVCLFGKTIQYNGNARKKSSIVNLGVYDGISKTFPKEHTGTVVPPREEKKHYQERLKQEEREKEEESDSDSDRFFAHLLYTSGDSKRSTVVSLLCPDENTKTTNRKDPYNGIIAVSEPQKLHYHIIIGLKRICDYESWLMDTFRIPKIKNDGVSTITNPTIEKKENKQTITTDIAELLKPLAKPCLSLVQGWWTVEFCFGQYVRQIHVQSKMQERKGSQVIVGQEIVAEHLMGKWDPNVEINASSFTIHKDEASPENTYVEMIYDNGQICELTEKSRSTAVQFRCAQQEKSSAIDSYREDEVCHYIVEISTPLICKHPDFTVPRPPSHEIICFPFEKSHFMATKKSTTSTLSTTTSTTTTTTTTTTTSPRYSEKLINSMNRQAQDNMLMKIIQKVIQEGESQSQQSDINKIETNNNKDIKPNNIKEELSKSEIDQKKEL